MTHDLSSLNIKDDNYTGADQLQVGNGQGLHISKTGTSSFHISSHSFRLNHVLYVPQLTKKSALCSTILQR